MDFFKKISSSFLSVKTKLSNKRVIIFLVVIILLLIPVVFLVISKDTKRVAKIKDEFDYFGALYVPDQLIVRLKEEYTAEDLVLLDRKFNELGVVGQEKAYDSDKSYLVNYYILKFKSGTDLRAAKKDLDSTGIIEDSHPNYIFVIQEVPNDPYYNYQWDLTKIGMPEVWDLASGGSNIKVAVIDTGIDYTHPDFVGRTILKGPNYAYCPGNRNSKTGFCLSPPGVDPMDDHGHGTHVAGTIGAVTNNSTGIAGINPKVTLMAIKTMKNDGKGEMSDNVNAMQYAIEHGANVMNMSLTSSKSRKPLPCSKVPELQDTINDAISKGIIVVVAAGNSNEDAANEIPTSCSGVIVVGATDAADKRWITNLATASNYGSRIDISAPGVNIISTYKNGGYSQNTGTSMAAPHVAGAAALLLSLKPKMSFIEIKNCLVNNADSITTDLPIGKRLNVLKAVTACAAKPSPSPTPTLPPTTTPSDSEKTIVINPSLPVSTFIYAAPASASNPVAQVNPGTALDVISENQSWYQVKAGTTTGWVAKANAVTPTPTSSPTPIPSRGGTINLSPTPAKTYNCSMAKGAVPSGAIQIGNLICTEVKK